MKRYPLEALRILRERREWTEAARLAAGLRDERAAVALRGEREVEVGALAARVAAPRLASRSAGAWQEAARFVARTREELHRARASLAEADASAARASASTLEQRALLAEAARRRGALDLHREAWRVRLRRERERREEDERDDGLTSRAGRAAG